MGRQSTLARLAFGRSPFEPPEQDEFGGFVMGPNVQHDTARNYVQQFDAKGHPYNAESEAARKRQIWAQNAALATVGVVVREAKSNRTPWQSMSQDDKLFTLANENGAGANCGVMESILQKVCARWIVSYRHRMLTFKSYLGLPLSLTMWSELSIVGPEAFFLAGMPCAMIAGLSQSFRDDFAGGDKIPNLHRSIRRRRRRITIKDTLKAVRTETLRVLWYGLEFPFQAFSILQALYLIPGSALPSPRAWIPFSPQSPIQLPALPVTWSLAETYTFTNNVLMSPFILAYVRDQLGREIFTHTYVIIRHLIVKPDKPDALSIDSALENRDLISETTIPGLNLTTKLRSRQRGPQNLVDTIRTLFPSTFRLWDRIFNSKDEQPHSEISPELRAELLWKASSLYSSWLRSAREGGIISQEQHDIFRRDAIRSAFAEHNLDMDAANVDLEEWTDMVNGSLSVSDGSTSTPDPLYLITEDGEVDNSWDVAADGDPSGYEPIADEHPAEGQPETNHIAEEWATDAEIPHRRPRSPTDNFEPPAPFQPAVPLERLLEPTEVEIPETEIEVVPPRIETPIPGISRAGSLLHTTPRPVRRPTEVNEGWRPERQGVSNATSPRESSKRAIDDNRYRVTILSTHPAETLAINSASLITMVLLLPYDMMYLRALTQGFLASAAGGSSTLSDDVWAPLDGFLFSRGFTTGMSFLGNWSLALGIHALIKFGIWYGSAWSAIFLGKGFGWGEF